MNRMGKMCLCLLLLAAGCGAAAEEEQTVQGGVCFRFEGNQTPENWKKMAEVFERGGGRFSASFHTQSIAGRADYAALLKRLSDAGHELLDGTPDNRMFAIHARSAEELERYRKEPAVHHVDPKSRMAFLRYEPNLEHWGVQEFRGSVRGNKLFDLSDGLGKRLSRGARIYLPLAGEVFTVAERKNGECRLLSFWGEDTVNLPEMKNLKLARMNSGSIAPTEEGMRFLARESASNFRRLGVPPAKVWIPPTGPEPPVGIEELFRIYGREFHYVAAASPMLGKKWSCIFFDPASRASFSMVGNCETPERKRVDALKGQIADAVAKHRVLMMVERMNTRRVPGGFQEYLRRHEELLKWLKEKQIPVRTMSDWAERLYPESPDFSGNIMPRLDRDLDGNSVPDGYRLSQGTRARNGVLFLPSGSGEVFSITELGGLRKGENVFRFSVNARPGTTLSFQFRFHRRGRARPESRKPLKFAITQSGWQTCSEELNIPRNVIALDLICRVENAEKGAELKELSLEPAPKPAPRGGRRDHRWKRAGWTPRRR